MQKGQVVTNAELVKPLALCIDVHLSHIGVLQRSMHNDRIQNNVLNGSMTIFSKSFYNDSAVMLKSNNLGILQRRHMTVEQRWDHTSGNGHCRPIRCDFFDTLSTAGRTKINL